MKINVEVGKKKFSLTPEEMIELRDKLIELTEKPISVPFPMYDDRIQPRLYPTTNPYIGDPLPNDYTITCNILN